MKRLEDAKIGECFHFITQSGKEYYLECVELVARTRYDYTEWCVSEQTYEVYVPRFKNQYGKVVCLQGNAELITKEEYEINLTPKENDCNKRQTRRDKLKCGKNKKPKV